MSEFTTFFNNLKLLIESAINSLPSEIEALLLTCFALCIAFFIYKFIR